MRSTEQLQREIRERMNEENGVKAVWRTKAVRPAGKPVNFRVLLYPFLFFSILFNWCFTMIQNLAEVVADSFSEIVIYLREYISPNAEKKPPVQADATTSESGTHAR
jgi:hypothetical protein